jgi:hypothetical protein
LSHNPLDDAAIVQGAYDSLLAAVEKCACRLGLNQDTAAIVDEIKKTMHEKVSAYGLTVVRVLCGRERAATFNQTDDELPQYFRDAIQDFMIVHDGRTPARKVLKTARNAWREDPGADRRASEMEHQSPDQRGSPYKGRPERYDRRVVLAFEAAIAHAFGRPRITWKRGRQTKDAQDNKTRGEMLDVLVAAVEWAMCVAWQAGRPGSKPPKVKAEGILRIVKAKGALTKSTD